ncbi:MAG: hypothetical protein CL607_09470 [Anaerolineaceae bacterium]|nr:hypothetical protein [Anaerolineaceae bacterium]
MSDDQNRPPEQPQTPPEGDNEDTSPSTIFVEMMREAAAKRAQRIDKREVYRRPKIDRVRRESAEEDAPASDPPSKPAPSDPSASQTASTESTPPEESVESRPATEPPAAPENTAPSVPEVEPDAAMPTYYEALFEETYPVEGDTDAPSVKATVHPSVPVYEPSAEELANAEKLAEQRVRRVARRKARRRQKRAGLAGGFVYTLLIVGIAACIGSTIFTWFTDPQFFDSAVVSGLQVVDTGNRDNAPVPTTMPTPNWMRRIGIVSGHRGPEDDPGAVCEENGTVTITEAEINFNVATTVVRNLRERGYSVDLLDEFDTRLENYQAAALVSIHANDCQDYGEVVSGFLVAKAAARAEGGPDTRLAECIAQYYGQATGLSRGSALTLDMTDYHSFREIHPLTPAAILELGFMRADRELLTERTEDLARGITEGIICFLNPTNQPIVQPTAETSG